MCVYVHVCVPVVIISICPCKRACVHAPACLYVHEHVCVHVHASVCVCVCASVYSAGKTFNLDTIRITNYSVYAPHINLQSGTSFTEAIVCQSINFVDGLPN